MLIKIPRKLHADGQRMVEIICKKGHYFKLSDIDEYENFCGMVNYLIHLFSNTQLCIS